MNRVYVSSLRTPVHLMVCSHFLANQALSLVIPHVEINLHVTWTIQMHTHTHTIHIVTLYGCWWMAMDDYTVDEISSLAG